MTAVTRRIEVSAERPTPQGHPMLGSHEVSLCGEKQALNHLFEYCIYDSRLWHRRKGCSHWHEMDFPGHRAGCEPKELSADGANLIVLDDSGKVYYRKVIEEEWRYEDLDTIHQGQYAYKNVHHDDRWEDRWVTLPVLHRLFGMIHGKDLHLPSDIRSWTVSHRGQYSGFLEDPSGERHTVVGCSTLFALLECGTLVRVYDPYLPQSANVSIPLPHSYDTTFVADNIEAAGSCLAAIGYELQQHPVKGVHKKLKLYTYLVDLDTLGWNPWFTYVYEGEARGDGIAKRVKDLFLSVVYGSEASAAKHQQIPFPTWLEQDLNVPSGARVTRRITILQTGQGNHARELRIEASDPEGNTGFYHRGITESEWTFVRDDHPILEESYLCPEMTVPNAVFEPKAHHWHGKTTGSDGSEVSLCVEHFGRKTLHGRMKIVCGNETHFADLYRRMNMVSASVFGTDSPHYDLIPDTDIPALDLKRRTPLRVHVDVSDDESKLSVKGTGWFGGPSFDLHRRSAEG